MPPEELNSTQHKNPLFALGLVTSLLHEITPFKSEKFGELVDELEDHISRKQYLITLSNQSKPLGYVGWGVCDRQVADDWAEKDYCPTNLECLQDGVVLIFKFYSTSSEVSMHQLRALKQLYPRHELLAKRIKPNGYRQVFAVPPFTR